jgi:hypothetical protein
VYFVNIPGFLASGSKAQLPVARIKLLGVRFSAGEYLRITSAAETSGLLPVAWIRSQALRALDLQAPAPARFEPPPQATPAARLTHTASTRFTEDQFKALGDHARACGLPVAAYIRRVVLGVNPTPRRPLAYAAIVAVNRVGNNLNQLVHLAHTGVVLAPDLLSAVAEVRRELQSLRMALLRADAADAEESL